MEKLTLNKIYTGTVEGYSSEGLGIVRLEGAVVFVPGAVRGETVDLRITKVMKTAAAGEIVKIRTSSPERVKPECPHYGTCGGCDFQHLSYAEELWAKRRRVQDALKRLGGTDLPVEEILGAKNPIHYRNKGQYPVGADGAIRLLPGPQPQSGAHPPLSHPGGGVRPNGPGRGGMDAALPDFRL